MEEKLFNFSNLNIADDVVMFIKNYDVYNDVKELMSNDIKILRTMFNILKSKDMSIATLLWLKNGLENELKFVSSIENKSKLISLFNLLMYYRYIDIKNNKKFGILLIKILINKISTIINFVFFDEVNIDKYELMLMDKTPIEDIKRQVELFNSHKLDVNSVIFNLKK